MFDTVLEKIKIVKIVFVIIKSIKSRVATSLLIMSRQSQSVLPVILFLWNYGDKQRTF